MTDAIAQRTRSVHPDLPQGKTALRIFPILGPSIGEPTYCLLEGDVLSAVRVTETSLSGSVPELKVDNPLETRVFLMDGQELVGAKQNRILNTDVLVPAKTTLSIPVSCVEAGRWRQVSPAFMPGKSASHAIRSRKSERVRDSMKKTAQFDADQSQVWNEVRMTTRMNSVASPTEALHDVYQQRRKDMEQFRQSLHMPEQAVGLAVFHGPRFLGLDLFDRHSTLVYFWQSLLESYAIDWLMLPAPQSSERHPPLPTPEARTVSENLERAASALWESFRSPGEGLDHRLDHPQLTGSALVWENRTVVHLQLFPKDASVTTADQPPVTPRPRIHRPYTRP